MAKLKQGAKIGPFPYRIVKTLGGGRGNMADVYLASVGEDAQADDAHRVVIKISKAHSDHQDFFEDTIYNEAERLRGLKHPGIVRLLSIQLDSNMRNLPYRARADALPGKPWFLVLEYLRGGALDELLKREKKLDVGLALEIASDVAGTLDYLHRKHQVHLDIKPENILFRQSVQPGWPAAPVLIDFGISRHVGQKGLEAGTLYYIPPERVAVQKSGQAPERFASPQPAMDVYSLGVVLYQMLTGHRPFEGRTDKRISSAILEANPTVPSHYREKLPPELDALVLKAMAKDPEDRPNAGEFALQLQELAGRYRYAAPPPTTPPGKPPGTGDAPGESNPHRVIRVLMMGLLVVAILIAILFSLNQPAISSGWGESVSAMLSNIPGTILSNIPGRNGDLTTMASTDTPTPPPTRTNTPTPTPPTPTSTPVPDRGDASATSQARNIAAAANPTKETPTATRTPTNTPTARPTSTPVPAKQRTIRTPARTPTRTPTKTPTRTPTKRPQAKKVFTSTPVVRKTPTPTRTPRPKATATPRRVDARPTATPKPPAPTPRPAPAQAGIPADAKVWGLRPGDKSAGHGRVTFSWSANFTPGPGQAFEAVFWRPGQDPMRDGKGWGGTSQQTSVTIKWDGLDVAPDTYHWGVLLVEPETATSEYRRLKYLGGGNSFNLEGPRVNPEESGDVSPVPPKR